MRTIETTVYNYDELPTDAAKERAREWYLEHGLYYEWWDSAYDDARTIGAALGFEVEKIFFSGFYSQGDGASFTGHYYYSPGWREKLRKYCPLETEAFAIGERLQAVQRPRRYRLQATITASGRYSHEGAMSAAVELDGGGDAAGDDAAAILECARDFARWIYSRLEAEHEYLTGEESVSEMLRANGYEFTADGRPVR